MSHTKLLLVSCMLALALPLGCEKQAATGETNDTLSLCKATVNHVSETISSIGGANGMSEKITAKAAVHMSIVKCESEGLSQAQADCILSAKNFEQFMAIGSCQAIVSKRPTWLHVPPPPQ